MRESESNLSRTVKVSVAEYNLLKAVRTLSQKQTLLLRVFEAEENLRKGKVEKLSFNSFLKSL